MRYYQNKNTYSKNKPRSEIVPDAALQSECPEPGVTYGREYA